MKPTPAASAPLAQAQAVLFDKDGTLFDFQKSWGAFGRRVILDLARGDGPLANALAEKAGLDLEAARYKPHAPIIEGSTRRLVEDWAALLPDWEPKALGVWLQREAGEASRGRMIPAARNLAKLLSALRAHGLVLGVATNDVAASARAQLADHGCEKLFAQIYGADICPAKPSPEMLLSFSKAVNIPCGRIVVVGDTAADFGMAHEGGAMAAVAVDTGPIALEKLVRDADYGIASINQLPELLGLTV